MANALQLLGLKHSGKSSVGRQWAAQRGWEFFDLDTLLEEAAGGNRSSRQIYTEEGKAGFQKYEAAAAAAIAGRLAQGNVVLAWGGGTVTNPGAVRILEGLGVLVGLSDRVEVLYERILRGGRPAFLSEAHPWEDFQKLYAERTALLRALTPWWIDLAGATVDQACGRLEEIWNRIPTGN